MSRLGVSSGRAYPLGATVEGGGVNFSVFSKHGTSVELLLFDRYDDPQPAHTIVLDPQHHKTFYYWHVRIDGIGPGQYYGYRVAGPYRPEAGHRFNYSKVLLDPYARCVSYGDNWSRQEATGFSTNYASSLKSCVVETSDFDWEGDEPLGLSFGDMVIYEMHVRGLTRHPSSRVESAGTFLGVVEKIPYLKSLGISAVELLPVQQFDPQTVYQRNPFTGERLTNYWGYEPIGFFAPHQGYGSDGKSQCALNEFREMVKALHRAGIEVILDVVFNHTAEGGADGPTISFRGLENRAYYMLCDDPSVYANYSGTGNTLNCNHSIVRRLITDCLRYWVQEMHVDGFRFDLAAILSRDEKGQPLANPPILWSIESDPVLASTKIIAEAWDAAGLYQVGSFIGDRWAEWNGRYRDDVRRFVRGDEGMVRSFAARLMGSPDLYRDPGRQPHRSINFITCHDGFTLNDLVSYEQKHNLSNGDENRDGLDVNFSWNCGVEGASADPEIECLRLRHIRSLFALLFVSQGTPMILMGDEVRRTQHGNSNAYCQDNEISWFDWRLVEQNAGLLRFVREIIRFNRAHPGLNGDTYVSEVRKQDGSLKYVTWHGVRLNQPDWGESSRSLAFTLHDYPEDEDIHVMVNAYWESLDFELPPLEDSRTWHRAVDTSLDSPADIAGEGEELPVGSEIYRTAPHSVVILVAR